jgi:hypothetical protein
MNMNELNPSEVTHLLKRFPPFELSYETISHKKVQSEYNLGIYIPIGKKYFIWFSFYGKQDVIFLMELNKEKKITKVHWIENTFQETLSLGAIFYGTFLEKGGEPEKISTFLIEDIFYYKGIFLKNIIFSEKLGFIYDYLKLYTDKTPIIHMVLPKIWFREPDSEPLEKDKPSYPVHHIQYRCLSRILPYVNIKQSILPLQNQKMENPQKNIDFSVIFRPDFSKPQYKYPTVFQVSADIQFDIYHLYAFGKNSASVYYNIAYIPNLKTSIFMNGIFRNIRENQNLDLIEESDDEEDFENIREDKYVDLNKTVLIECMFHQKFKKWVPVRVVNKGERIIHISRL